MELRAKPGAGESAFELGALDDSVAFLLRAAYDASAQAFERRAAHLDVSAGEYASLTVIDANPGITQGQLGLATGRHMSTLTPILRSLEQGGFITRSTLRGDRRSSAIALTKRGRERLLTIAAVAAEHDRDMDRIVGKANKAQFARILRRIRALVP